MQKTTVKTIMDDMKLSVEENQVQSPGWWMDKAIMLNVLWGDLKNELTKYEMMYKSEMAALIADGRKIGEAHLMVEGRSENYKMYQYLKGRDNQIDEFIKLAKARAKVESYME